MNNEWEEPLKNIICSDCPEHGSSKPIDFISQFLKNRDQKLIEAIEGKKFRDNTITEQEWYNSACDEIIKLIRQ